MLTGALRQLFALAEAYPDLKANQNFLALQEELTSTEDRIAYARQFYNDSVLKYNNKIAVDPRRTSSPGMFNFDEREYFEVEDAADATFRASSSELALDFLIGPHRVRTDRRRTSARRALLIIGFALLVGLVGRRRSTTSWASALVGFVIVAVVVIAIVVHLVLQQRQGRAGDESRRSPPTSAPYARYHNLVGGTVHRERAAEAAPLHHRRRRAERVRDRS